MTILLNLLVLAYRPKPAALLAFSMVMLQRSNRNKGSFASRLLFNFLPLLLCLWKKTDAASGNQHVNTIYSIYTDARSFLNKILFIDPSQSIDLRAIRAKEDCLFIPMIEYNHPQRTTPTQTAPKAFVDKNEGKEEPDKPQTEDNDSKETLPQTTSIYPNLEQTAMSKFDFSVNAIPGKRFKEAIKLSDDFIKQLLSYITCHFDFGASKKPVPIDSSHPNIFCVESNEVIPNGAELEKPSQLFDDYSAEYSTNRSLKKSSDQSTSSSQQVPLQSVFSRAIVFYRPVLWPDGDPGAPVWHEKMHDIANASFETVFSILKDRVKNSEIIFVGLENGGAVALLHACRVIKELTNQLASNQIKLITFETSPILTKSILDAFAARTARFPLSDKNHLAFRTAEGPLYFNSPLFSQIGFDFALNLASHPDPSRFTTDDVLAYIGNNQVDEQQMEKLVAQLKRIISLKSLFSLSAIDVFRERAKFYIQRNADYAASILAKTLKTIVQAEDNMSNGPDSGWRATNIEITCNVVKYSPGEKFAEIDCSVSMETVARIARFAVVLPKGNVELLKKYSPIDQSLSPCFSKLFECGQERIRMSPFHSQAFMQKMKLSKPKSDKMFDFHVSVATSLEMLTGLLNSNPSIFYRIFAAETFKKPAECSGILNPPPITGYKLGNATNLRGFLSQFIQQHIAAYEATVQTDKAANFDQMQLGSFKIIQTRSNQGPEAIAAHKILYDNREIFSECLRNNTSELGFFDCREPLTQWASDGHCPNACIGKAKRSRLCSRILRCEGNRQILLRGASLQGNFFDRTTSDFSSFDTTMSPSLGSFVFFHVTSTNTFDYMGLKNRMFFGFYAGPHEINRN